MDYLTGYMRDALIALHGVHWKRADNLVRTFVDRRTREGMVQRGLIALSAKDRWQLDELGKQAAEGQWLNLGEGRYERVLPDGRPVRVSQVNGRTSWRWQALNRQGTTVIAQVSGFLTAQSAMRAADMRFPRVVDERELEPVGGGDAA